MTKDPIVLDVRKAGAKLAEEAGNDTHCFFENLRSGQKKYGSRLVGKGSVKVAHKAESTA
jgi:hypothetical protein